VSADLTHVDTWLFDLDNTLYPPECGLMGRVSKRMTEFVAHQTGLSWDEARALQKRYYHEHGTTLAGMMAHHGVDPAAYIAEVQDVGVDCVRPDPELGLALERLPGRRLVFTNAGGAYAERVLDRLGISPLFEAVFHIEASDYIPKPQPHAFARMVERHGVQPRRCAFFEDTEWNLAPAAALGMTTVLVRPDAEASKAAFVDHRTANLTAFLSEALIES